MDLKFGELIVLASWIDTITSNTDWLPVMQGPSRIPCLYWLRLHSGLQKERQKASQVHVRGESEIHIIVSLYHDWSEIAEENISWLST